MGFYEIIVGIGTIIVASFIWVFLSYAVQTMSTTFIATMPTQVGGYPVDIADITTQYNYADSVYYFFFLFLTIVILVWIVRTSITEQGRTFGGD